MRSPWVWLVALGATVYLSLQLGPLALGRGQNDLRSYYFAARAWDHSQTPYAPHVIAAVSGEDRPVPYFVYSPATLPLFGALQRVPLPFARLLFLILKLAAVVGLVIVWLRMYPREVRPSVIFILTLILGYDEAILRDVRAGNVSVFEQLLLWSGLLMLVRGSLHSAGIGIAASAFFKQVTGGFLLLLPVRAGGRAAGALALGGSVLVAPHLFAAALDPNLFREFLARSSGTLLEEGQTNPSTLIVAWQTAQILGVSRGWGTMAYVLVATAALACFAALVWRRQLARDPLLLVSTAAFAYALALPRMKDYSYILLLMPSLHVVRVGLSGRLARALCYCALWISVLPYQPWLVAASLYGVLIIHVVSSPTEVTPTRSS